MPREQHGGDVTVAGARILQVVAGHGFGSRAEFRVALGVGGVVRVRGRGAEGKDGRQRGGGECQELARPGPR